MCQTLNRCNIVYETKINPAVDWDIYLLIKYTRRSSVAFLWFFGAL